jgi:hypothetical protein
MFKRLAPNENYDVDSSTPNMLKRKKTGMALLGPKGDLAGQAVAATSLKSQYKVPSDSSNYVHEMHRNGSSHEIQSRSSLRLKGKKNMPEGQAKDVKVLPTSKTRTETGSSFNKTDPGKKRQLSASSEL